MRDQGLGGSDKLLFCLGIRHRTLRNVVLIAIRSQDNSSNAKHSLCAEMMKLTDCNERRRQATSPNDRRPFIEVAQDLLFSDRSSDVCLWEQPDQST